MFITTPITPIVRKEVFAAWNNTCAYCRVRAAEHCDHIVPSAKGGQDCLENYAAACATCNLMKSDMMFGEGLLHMILAYAARKAPAIRTRIKARSGEKPDPSDALADLVQARTDLTAFMQAAAPQDIAAIQAQQSKIITDTFSGASISTLKAAATSDRGKLRAERRRIALNPLREVLIDLKIAAGVDAKAARDEVGEVYSTCTRSTLEKAINHQRRLNAPRAPDKVNTCVPAPLRRELADLLSVDPDSDPDQVHSISLKQDQSPDLFGWFEEFCSRGDIASWRRKDGTSCLFYALGVGQEIRIEYRGHTSYFLKISEKLDAETFEFPSEMEAWHLPDAQTCVAA